ncbi:hypothetical protein TNCV_4602841 [Trichonephila clavipes]|nr:hypothetical protein TNCV_4602841 [Trichonephila clavipes]
MDNPPETDKGKQNGFDLKKSSKKRESIEIFSRDIHKIQKDRGRRWTITVVIWLVCRPFHCRKFRHGMGFNENEYLVQSDICLSSSSSNLSTKVYRTATTGSDVVQSERPIFDDFFQHLWPYFGNITANVVFQMVRRLWLIRIDQ